MSWLSKRIRKVERLVKRNKRLNRAARKLRDILLEDIEDAVNEHIDPDVLEELYYELARLRRNK